MDSKDTHQGLFSKSLAHHRQVLGFFLRQKNLSEAAKDVVIVFTLVQKKQHSLPLCW